MYVRLGYSSVPASNSVICRMIKEAGGDRIEEVRPLEQDLTFEKAGKEFADRNIKFGQAQMKTPGIMTQDGVYTNLGLRFPTSACIRSRRLFLKVRTRTSLRIDRKEFTGSLFKQMDDVYDFIDFRNQTHSTFEPDRQAGLPGGGCQGGAFKSFCAS